MKGKSNLWLDAFVIGLPLFVITFLYSFALIDPVLLPKFLGWGLFLLLLGGLLLARGNHYFQPAFKGNPVLWALSGYLLLSALSLMQTRNLPDGLFEWYKGFFLFTSIIFLVTHFYHKRGTLITGLTLGTACLAYVAAAFGFYQFLEVTEQSGLSHAQSYGISGTFAHRNLYAEVLFLTLPFNIFGFFRLKKGYKWFSLGAAFLALFIIVILMSRAVWLSVMTGILAPTLVYIFMAIKSGELGTVLKNRMPAILKGIGGVVLVIGLSVFVYTRFGSGTAFKKQVVSIFQFNFTYGSIKDRIDLWSKSWEIIKDRPVTGVGLGDWEQALLAKGNKGMLSEDNKTFFQRPHNDFLWVCSESGIFAMLCYIGIFGGAFYLLLRKIWKDPYGPNVIFNYFLLFALTGYLTYALFSFPKERIEHQVLLSFILALTSLQAISSNNASVPNHNKGPMLGIGLGLVIVGSGLFMGVKRLEAEARTSKALKARMSQNPKGVIRHIEEAESPYYRIDPMSTPLRWYSGSAHHKLGQKEQALQDFKIAYRLNPYHMHVVNNLGTLYQIQGHSDSAIKYYKEALELSASFTTATLNLAAVYFNEGEVQNALDAISQIPYQEENPKYEKYLTAILRSRTKTIQREVNEEKIRSVISRMLKNNEWLRKIFNKSLNTQAFKYQLLEDVIYVLEKEEKSISFEEAKRLKQKYLNHD